ncbi:MAG: hypothetical protein JWP25_4709 [Bradyrhizobium sp.]|nr:hypothetical protein [Bradyrhizobium sp.]
MTRWFRFYEESLNDPKLLRLSDGLYRAWTMLLCFASKNDGILPAVDDMAAALRTKPSKVSDWIEKLVAGGLIDRVGDHYEPHNWSGRQYKSDVSTDRVKRFRNGKRNVSVTPPETEQKQITEQSRAEPRDELKIRTGNFQQAIVQAFAAANSPDLPETSRAGLWLSQGYQEDICLAVIAELVRKKPSITTLNYFDNAIREAHASKAPARKQIEIANPSEVDWDVICSMFKKFGRWSPQGGNHPDSGSCRCPPEILAKYGIVSATGHDPPPAPSLRAMQ